MADETLLSSNLSGLIPTKISQEIITGVTKESFCLINSKRELMDTYKTTVSFLADMPGPTWVAEGKKINVVKPTILPVELEAKKLGFIITASRETLSDTVLNTFDKLKNSIKDSFATVIDKAIISGDTIEDGQVFQNTLISIANKQPIKRSKNIIADDISDSLAVIEDKGYSASNILAINSIKNELRKAKTTTGDYLYKDVNNLFGTPMNYNNQLDKTKGYAIAGDFKNYLLTGIYQDISYDVLREATLDLNDGKTINLAQEDLVGIRVTMRVAANILRHDAFSLVSVPEESA